MDNLDLDNFGYLRLNLVNFGQLIIVLSITGNGKHLAEQDYAICIRSEKGFCSICMSADV